MFETQNFDAVAQVFFPQLKNSSKFPFQTIYPFFLSFSQRMAKTSSRPRKSDFRSWIYVEVISIEEQNFYKSKYLLLFRNYIFAASSLINLISCSLVGNSNRYFETKISLSLSAVANSTNALFLFVTNKIPTGGLSSGRITSLR